mmetsp:Transcript_18063/g.44247  ORF Transcript_18063/g.44247 Transcript_18063/m.44247 type:complete len:396 (+) Transcript_18063:1835-3022(+)
MEVTKPMERVRNAGRSQIMFYATSGVLLFSTASLMTVAICQHSQQSSGSYHQLQKTPGESFSMHSEIPRPLGSFLQLLSKNSPAEDKTIDGPSLPQENNPRGEKKAKGDNQEVDGGAESGKEKIENAFLRNLWLLVNNRVLLVGITTCLLTQVMKVPFHSLLSWIHLNRTTWECGRVGEAGGMPSSHTSCCSAVVMTIGLREGFDSYLFALAAIITLVIAHDAMGVRWAASRHARFINAVVRMENSGFQRIPSTNTMRMFENLRQSPLKEKLGHRSQEVVVGFIFGLAYAALAECQQDSSILWTLLGCTLLMLCGKFSLCCCCGSKASMMHDNKKIIPRTSVTGQFSDSYQDFRVLRDGYPQTRDLPIMEPKSLSSVTNKRNGRNGPARQPQYRS